MHSPTGTWKQRDEADPSPPPSPATQSDPSQSEPVSPHSSGSSSDSHSSGSPNSSSSLSPTSGSKLSSGSQSILLESSPESSRHTLEVSFALPPPPIRSTQLKRHSPLNPTSFRDPPFTHLKPQRRPSINPLMQGSYGTGSLSAGSSSSGSRLHLNHFTTYENVFFPRSPSFAARSSASSTLGGSTISLLSDWKHESLLLTKDGSFIPFPSDLYLVDNEPMNEDDMNFSSDGKIFALGNYQISARGLGCIVTIVILVSAILALFVIYPVFSFYLDDSPNTAILNGNSTDLKTHRSIINARNQEPLSNRVDSNRPPSVLRARGSEYELSFSDEWELEGRRFGPDQDEVWMSLINDDASTTRKGHLILDQQAHLQTRVPHCLGSGGFIDVGFAAEDVGKLQRAYWTGNWSAMKEDALDALDVLPASEVARPVLVTLHIEFDGDFSPVAVDYVRFYSLQEPYRCDDDAPVVSVRLELHKPLIP